MALKGVVSSATLQGARKYQEDRIVHVPFVLPRDRGHLIGVFDGHGGAEAAQLCAQLTPQLFRPTGKYPAEDVGELLRNLIKQLEKRTNNLECGTTVSLVCILEERRVAVTASLGDSPIIIRDTNGFVRTNNPHNVRSNIAEREAVLRRGGVYSADGYIHNAPNNDYGLPSDEGLQLSRALGDKNLRYIISREPDIAVVPLSKESAVIVSSDGFVDPERLNRFIQKGYIDDFSDHNMFLQFLYLAQTFQPAQNLIRWRKQDELADNVSIIVWRPRKWFEWW